MLPRPSDTQTTCSVSREQPEQNRCRLPSSRWIAASRARRSCTSSGRLAAVAPAGCGGSSGTTNRPKDVKTSTGTPVAGAELPLPLLTSFRLASPGAEEPLPRAGALPPLRLPSPPEPRRLQQGRDAVAPASSAIPGRPCTPRTPIAVPGRAVSGPRSSGWKSRPSRVLQLPPLREEAASPPPRRIVPWVHTTSGYRTGHACVKLPPLSHLPHESGRTRERHRVRLADSTSLPVIGGARTAQLPAD